MDYLFGTVKLMQGRQRQIPLNFNKHKYTYKIIQCRYKHSTNTLARRSSPKPSIFDSSCPKHMTVWLFRSNYKFHKQSSFSKSDQTAWLDAFLLGNWNGL